MNNFVGSWGITRELFDWIRDTLPDGKTILELGSGRGTVKLLEHYKVYSIEHSKRWLGLAKGGNYIYAPIKKYSGYSWYDADTLTDLPQYDLLLVDGPPGTIGRMGIIKYRHLFDMTVPIIVDDTHRRDEQAIAVMLAGMYSKEIKKYGSTKKKFTTLT